MGDRPVAPTFGLTLAGGFRSVSLEWALNLWPVLPVRAWPGLLVPVKAFRYVQLLYAQWEECQEGYFVGATLPG